MNRELSYDSEKNPIDKFFKELFKKQIIPFLTLATSGSPDILLSFHQRILFLNLVRKKKNKKLYILRISISRKLLQDRIFYYFLFYIFFFYCILCSIFLSFRLIKKRQSLLFCLQIEVRNSNIFSIYFSIC